MKKMSRKERERQRHRSEIMSAAEKVFSSKGYHDTSIQDIARVAEFSVGTLYNFFESKEALFSCILKHGLGELFSELDAGLLGVECPVQKIRVVISTHLVVVEKHKSLIRLLFDYTKPRLVHAQQGMDEEIVSMHLNYLDRVTGVFSEAIEQGKIKQYDPSYLAISLEGMMGGFIEHYSLLEGFESFTEVIPLIEDIFLNGILA
jgi:TetR/AcrR family transcriptional regulator